jgi:hypothetical protein
MRYVISMVLASGGLLLASGVPAVTLQTQSTTRQSAVVVLVDKTKIGDVVLQGKYVFEHDDGRMSPGEPCMYIYTYEQGKPGKLVVSFHCKPVDRPPARELVVNVAMTREPEVFELKEIQFAGTSKGHLVP